MERDRSASTLFLACDLDGSGYIDEAELAKICPELSNDELKEVFQALDKDGDGRISKDEFSRGFKEIGEALRERRKSRLESGNSLDDTSLEEFIGDLDDGLKTLTW